MVICALPLLSVTALEEKLLLVSVTDPAGVPLLPLTVTVTTRLCAVVMLDDAGETVTVGVVAPDPPLPPPPGLLDPPHPANVNNPNPHKMAATEARYLIASPPQSR